MAAVKKKRKTRAKRKTAKPRFEPPDPGTLPARGAKMLTAVYERSRGEGRSKSRSAELAWGVVKKDYYKRGDKWHRRKRRLKAGEAAPKYSKNPRAPDLADLGTVAELGRVRELIVDNPNGKRERYTWKGKRPLLLWSPKQRALVWVEGVKPSGRRKGAPRSDGAAKVFEQWAKNATTHRVMNVPAKKPHRVGRAVSIAYTEPFGRHPRKGGVWEHDFAPSDSFWQAGTKSPFTFAVTGRRLTVTDRGIVY